MEMVIPSIFVGCDPKRHMSINLETGLWQCFKTSNKGNFIQLYAKLENITSKEAYDTLVFKSFFFEDKEPTKKAQNRSESPKILEDLGDLEEVTIDTGDSSTASDLAVKAWCILYDRHLIEYNINQKYFVCHSGKFRNRLIIPFYMNDKMVFFQARDMFGISKVKYLNPSEIKASQILPPFDYSRPAVFVIEGPTDRDWETILSFI